MHSMQNYIEPQGAVTWHLAIPSPVSLENA
jgi:hypothetical protein